MTSTGPSGGGAAEPTAERVYRSLRRDILHGRYRPGEPLPAERTLSERLDAGPAAVREALQRLADAGLVATGRGGARRVLDYWQRAGLAVLPELLLDGTGRFDPEVLRGAVEMRSALSADTARLAALRGGADLADRLYEVVDDMGRAGGDLAALQALAMAFWEVLVRGSGNPAYRLAFNSLRDTHDRYQVPLREVLRDELTARDHYRGMAAAVAGQDAAGAERAARELTAIGAASLLRGLDTLEAVRRGRGGA